MDKYQLSERDICTKFITPAIQQAGWQQHQFREEVNLTDGRVMVRGKLAARVRNPEAKGGPKRADFVLYARTNLPVAIVEAKQAHLSVGHGMQQALALCDKLEAQQHERRKLQNALRQSTLQAVPTATKTTQLGEWLAHAAVSSLTGIAIEQEEEQPAPHPETEAIA